MNDPGGRWAWAEVDAAAIEHNVAVVRAAAGGGGGGALVGEHTPSMGAMGSGSSPGGALANVEKSKQR